MTESKELFIIAASGTGGHIFPGLFIAQALLDEAKEKGAEVVVEFIGSGRPLEAKLIDSRGYRRHSIAMHGVVGRGLRGTLQAIVNFPIACAKIWKLYSKHRPRVVIGVGGYSSVAPIFVAWLRRIPTWIHEAEARPGLANAVLSIIASKISLSWSECRMWSRRTVITGHPVRQELRKVTPVAKERPENLLILGGSQGARSLDLAALNLAQYFKESGLKVWHQCREENLSMLESHYSEVHLSFRVNTFVDDM
ncbi:MAG: glycosyltransferase, partial [Bdellovibrionales bacterium]|nr:glycosyltransferase [Bdellovibrionales bacterium]